MAQAAVQALPAIERLHVIEHMVSRFITRLEALVMRQLLLRGGIRLDAIQIFGGFESMCTMDRFLSR